MPTILREKGFRISFFAGDRNEPIHVHAKTADGREAKFWIPARVAKNKGLRSHELRDVEDIINKNEKLIYEKWNETFRD